MTPEEIQNMNLDTAAAIQIQSRLRGQAARQRSKEINRAKMDLLASKNVSAKPASWNVSALAGDGKAKMNRRGVSVAREAASAFLNADRNGDGRLTYEEFESALPERMKEKYTTFEIEEVFKAADLDGSGDISTDEFFLWTLSILDGVGSGLEALFRNYDKSGSGTLDASEFALAIEDLGFGGFGHELFLELDRDGSGSITFSELMKLLKSKSQGKIKTTTKRFLTVLAFDDPSLESDMDLQMETWNLQALDAESLRQEVQDKLIERSAKASDLYKNMTMVVSMLHGHLSQIGENKRLKESIEAEASTTSVTRDIFFKAFKYAAGFKGEAKVLLEIFDSMDEDRSGAIGLTELHRWMNNIIGRKTLARSLRLRDRGRHGTSLEDLEWTPNVLREQIQLMLMHARLAPLDLIRSWDLGGADGSHDMAFSRREFLSMLKRMVDDLDLWDWAGVRDIVVQTFELLSGSNKSIDVVEFERWLNFGWIKRLKLLALADEEAELNAQDNSGTPLHEAIEKVPQGQASSSAPQTGMQTAALGHSVWSTAPSASQQMSAPRVSRDSPFRPRPLRRSASVGLCSSSCALTASSHCSAKSSVERTPSWMQPIGIASRYHGSPALPTYRATPPRRFTSPHLTDSHSSPHLNPIPLPSRSDTMPIRRDVATARFVPLNRPNVGPSAMLRAAAIETAMINDATDELIAKANKRAAVSLRRSSSLRPSASLDPQTSVRRA